MYDLGNVWSGEGPPSGHLLACICLVCLSALFDNAYDINASTSPLGCSPGEPRGNTFPLIRMHSYELSQCSIDNVLYLTGDRGQAGVHPLHHQDGGKLVGLIHHHEGAEPSVPAELAPLAYR